jgi:gluconate 2-dehydrogenase gamma chain
MNRINRRQFIKQSALWYGGLLLLPGCRSGAARSQYTSFTQGEADCLIALCEQVIPADDTPGATDAGVIFYIDGTVMKYFPDQLTLYRGGIASLQSWCQAEHGGTFESLASDIQVEIMKKMETPNSFPAEEWSAISPQGFLSMVIRHTMQGFYGLPRHGGNKNMVSYRMLKLDYPMVAGQNRYTNG